MPKKKSAASRPGAYTKKKGGKIRNAKDEKRAAVVKKRDDARKKVKVLENRWDVTTGGKEPLMKKRKKRVAKKGK